MFSLIELLRIREALVLQRKSYERHAAKPGQPESVAGEYRRVVSEVIGVQNHVDMEVNKMQESAKQVKK